MSDGRIVIPAIAVALLATACTDSTLEIRMRGSLTDSSSLAGIAVSIDGRTYSAADFTGRLNSLKIDVPNSGTLRISVRLQGAGGILVDSAFTMRMRSDYEWGVDVFRQETDPTELCFGCSGSAGFPLIPVGSGGPVESLWFTWGGRPRGSDIVF